MTAGLVSARATAWADRWIIPALEQAGILGPEERARVEAVGGASAWHACVSAGIASDDEVLDVAAQRFHMPAARASDIDAASAWLLPGEVALRLRVVPLDLIEHVLHIACADPIDLELENAVAFAAGHRVRLHLASPTTIEKGLALLYPATAISVTGERPDRAWRIPA